MSDVQCERIGNMYDNSYGGGMDGNVYAPTVCAPTLKAIGGGARGLDIGGLRAMTLFSIFALRGRDRDNPSLRGRSNENYEQRMELIGWGQTCTITSVQKDNLVLEIYSHDKSN